MKRPIETINPLLGDESFVAAFGRLPTAHDDIPLRIATHVGYVARQLRERGASDPGRTGLLDALDTYVAAGRFPASETDHGFLPTFVDPSGVRCAVAHLVETSVGTDAMLALDRDHHNGFISDLAGDPRFVAWAAGSGFTVEELAWIQPGYPPPPPPDIAYVLAVTGQVAVAHETPDAAARGATALDPLNSFALAAGSLRYTGMDDFRPILELAGALGITSDEHTAYAAGARLGGELHMNANSLAITAGVTTDSYGPTIPRAWSLPLDVAYHHVRDEHYTWGVHAGRDFALGDVRDSGWDAGVELRAKKVMCEDGRWHPRDVVIGLDAMRLADSTFVGVTIGVGNEHQHHWSDDY